MADAQVSGTCGGNIMWVQLPSSAPKKQVKTDLFFIVCYFPSLPAVA